MSIADLAMAAILSVAHSPAVDASAEHRRLAAMASDIAYVVQERDELASWLPGAVDPLPFRGPRAREASALALVAIAAHESGLRADVADCSRTGDRLPGHRANEGRSITAYQLMRWPAWGSYNRAQLCSRPRLAAERALAVLAMHGRCKNPAGWFAAYASGSCAKPSAASRRQCRIWERLTRAAGLRASCLSRRVDDL